jgi:hypothetical protein
MSFIRTPRCWLCMAAFAAAFWITFRVMASPGTQADLAAQAALADNVNDPVLGEMVSRFAATARISVALDRQ